MSMNIKNEEVHRMAAELAQLRGVSLTQAVKDAVQRDLEREKNQHKKKGLAKELMEIGRRFSASLNGEPLEDHGTFLYDERGLPK